MKRIFFSIAFALLTCIAQSQNFEVIDNPDDHSLIGKPVPNIISETLSGKTFNLKDYRGKVVLLNFWGLNCAVCYKEIVELNSLIAQYGDKGLVVVSVLEDTRDEAIAKIKNTGPFYSLIKPVANNSNINFELIPGGENFKSIYAVDGVPMNFVIDKNGIVREFSNGYRASVTPTSPSENYKVLASKIEDVIGIRSQETKKL